MVLQEQLKESNNASVVQKHIHELTFKDTSQAKSEALNKKYLRPESEQNPNEDSVVMPQLNQNKHHSGVYEIVGPHAHYHPNKENSGANTDPPTKKPKSIIS